PQTVPIYIRFKVEDIYPHETPTVSQTLPSER
ncbi:unnamed protein product, partial [marine sediment metagenome]